MGSAVNSPSGVGAKTDLVYSKAVRKPLVAIILNILSTMFYVFEEINWRWCRHNTVPLSHIRSITVSGGVSPSPKGEPDRSPSKSDTDIVKRMHLWFGDWRNGWFCAGWTAAPQRKTDFIWRRRWLFGKSSCWTREEQDGEIRGRYCADERVNRRWWRLVRRRRSTG